MQLFEMQGLLAGKCLPGDMLVGESLSQYFLRQFNQRDELARQVSALQTSQDNIINGLGIKGDGPYSQLVLEKFIALQAKYDALEAEGTVMRDAINQTIGWQESTDPQNTESVRLLVSLKTPATDAEFAEIKVQGVDALASTLWSRANELVSEGAKKSIVIQTRFAAKLAEEFAANLRAGRKG